MITNIRPRKFSRTVNLFYTSLTVTLLFSLSSCTIKPVKLTKIEKSESVNESLSKLHVQNDNNFKINLRQAIGLALRNNLEYKLQKVQQAFAYKQFDLAKTEMYPSLDMSYAYDQRNRDYVKELVDVGGDSSEAQSLIPHTIKTGSVLFNWNVLDLGLSYVRAKQASDRYLIVQEQRKQIASRIISQVIKNYTMAYYGQELQDQIKELESDVSKSLSMTDNAIAKGVGKRQSLLEYKKGLIAEYRAAKDYLILFQQARESLFNLINFNRKDKIEVAQLLLEKPDPYLTKLPSVDSKLLPMDTISLYLRPEISEAVYKIRETDRQRYVVVLEKLPSFGFNFGYNYDSDKYLLHQNWWSNNMSIAWNILNMATIPAALDTTEAQLEAARLTHLASSAAVLGELRVALYNYKMKKYDYHLAEKDSEFTTKLYNHNVNLATAGMGDGQSLVKYKLSSVNSELSKLRAFVDARNLFEDLVVAMGLYSSEGEFINKSDVELGIVANWMEKFNKNEFDNIIADQYIKIRDANKLAEVSELHKESHESEDKPNTGKQEHHARLKLNIPQGNENLQLAGKIGNYLAKLFSYTV